MRILFNKKINNFEIIKYGPNIAIFDFEKFWIFIENFEQNYDLVKNLSKNWKIEFKHEQFEWI